MRKLLGGAVAALSVGALGFYANNNHAERMQTNVTAGAEQVAVSSVHGVTTSVSGRDITVSGLAHSESERDTLVTALQKVDGRRVVIDELTVLATASPYEMFSTKTADGRTFGGVTPNETARAYVGEAMGSENAAGLELAAGMPDERWPEVGNAGLAALDILETGTMTLSDRKLTVMGTARTPVEVAAAENLSGHPARGIRKRRADYFIAANCITLRIAFVQGHERPELWGLNPRRSHAQRIGQRNGRRRCGSAGPCMGYA